MTTPQIISALMNILGDEDRCVGLGIDGEAIANAVDELMRLATVEVAAREYQSLTLACAWFKDGEAFNAAHERLAAALAAGGKGERP